MTTTLRQRATTRGTGQPAPTSERTVAGTSLQAVWLSAVAWSLWASAFGPEHPPAPPALEVLAGLLGAGILAATAGLLRRRRWALWLSVGLALPMVAAAVLCQLADAGSHWIAEAALAVGVVAGSFHPGSWRMHTR